MNGFMIFLLLAQAIIIPIEDPKPIKKSGPCPPGYYSIGNYCSPGNNPKTVIEKSGPCPPGYYGSGKYCVKN